MRILIFVWCIICSVHGFAQKKVKLNCDRLDKQNCKTILVKGYEDYGYQVEVSWLKEEIPRELLTIWYKDSKGSAFKNGVYDEKVQRSIIDNETEHLLVRYDQAKDLLGDEYQIFYYQTPREYWKDFQWQEGIVFVRGCQIIAEIVLTQS